MPDRQVEQIEGKKLADSFGISFFETSAKDNINIEECFSTIAREIKEKLIDHKKGRIFKGDRIIEIETSIYIEKEKGGYVIKRKLNENEIVKKDNSKKIKKNE